MPGSILYSVVIARVAVFSSLCLEMWKFFDFFYIFPVVEHKWLLIKSEHTDPRWLSKTNGGFIITEVPQLFVVSVEDALVNDNLTCEDLGLIEDFAKVSSELSHNKVLSVVQEESIEVILATTNNPKGELILTTNEFENDSFPCMGRAYSEDIMDNYTMQDLSPMGKVIGIRYGYWVD